jgi:hypothetical protein
MKYAFDEEELLEAFTNLLASCIDVDYSSIIHPSFVERIKQLTCFDLKVLEFIGKQPMFFYSELFVNCTLCDAKGIVFPQLYLFSNMCEFDGNPQYVDKSIDLLISLGILEVDRREIFKSDEYANRLVKLRDFGYESEYKSDLFSDYFESCAEEYDVCYDEPLYSHDRFFFGIELSPELENMIFVGCGNKTDIIIAGINSTRRIIVLTSYGKHFRHTVFRSIEEGKANGV